MPTIWTIGIDWNRDGDYGDSHEDLTARVQSATWFLGMRQPYQDMADNSVMQIVLRNDDKLLSPDNTASPLWDAPNQRSLVQPFCTVRVQSNDGTTTRTHWFGWIETIQPEVNRYGKRTVKLTATGVMQFYKAAETKIKLQEKKNTKPILEELIKEVVVPPIFSRAWILGRDTNSRVGVTTYLTDTSAYSTLDTGLLTLGMAGDNWGVKEGAADAEKSSFDVYRAIGDITAAEHGKFVFDREGKALFWNRHRLLHGGTPVATFNDTMTDLAYAYASLEQTKNEILVICHPRTISDTADNLLWQLGEAIIRIEPGKKREVYVKYEDESKNRIGAKDVTVTNVQFEAGTATVTVEPHANGTNLIFDNVDPKVPALVKKCEVKGRKITDSGEIEAKATDTASIVDYGRRSLRINLPSIDNLEQAQYIADFERDRRGQPRGEVSAITMLSHGKNGGGEHVHQLARTLGDLIAVQETQTSHNKQYFIVGEAHELTMGATLWKSTWYLEPAPSVYPWKVSVTGRSELGQTTRLAY
jgi:hypothetical protein